MSAIKEIAAEYQATIQSLRAQVERLEKALQFYANSESWKNHPQGGGEEPIDYICPVAEDVGDIARAALEQE